MGIVTYATYAGIDIPWQKLTSMRIRKVRELGSSDQPSAGITLPKGDLREDGVIDDQGGLEEQYAKVEKTGDGEYRVRLVDF